MQPKRFITSMKVVFRRWGKQAVSRGGGANRMLVEGWGKQDVSGGGANRMLVEMEGQTGC